jgi:hypothetical protein
MNGEIDLELQALLRTPERAPDEAFAARVAQAVLVEQRLSAARRVAWTRFGAEMLAAASAIAAFWLLARLTPPDSDGVVPLFSPAAMGLVVLGLWVLVSMRGPEGRFSGPDSR